MPNGFEKGSKGSMGEERGTVRARGVRFQPRAVEKGKEGGGNFTRYTPQMMTESEMEMTGTSRRRTGLNGLLVQTCTKKNVGRHEGKSWSQDKGT